MTSTAENINNDELSLARKELFEGVTIECYEDSNGNFRITRKQIGEALGYGSKRSSFNSIFQRNGDAIGEPAIRKLRTTDGKAYDTETYTFNQLFQILRFSKQPLANSFMDWASLTLEQLILNKAELKFHKTEDLFDYKQETQKIFEQYMKETNIRFDELNKKLSNMENTLFFKQYTKPTHRFESALTKFAIHYDLSGAGRYSKFYNAFENWLGAKLPRGKNYTTKEYVLNTYDIELIEMFIDGIISGRITESTHGNYIDLNGVFNNPIEWDKVKEEFNHECAYCGTNSVPLIEEHVIPQSHSMTSDTIKNIVPSCQECNKSKNNEILKVWYPKQSFYDEVRREKVINHYHKYNILED